MPFTRFVPLSLLAAVLVSACRAEPPAAAPVPAKPELRSAQLPVLNWTPRSDWRSVKEFGAMGDGIADDTAAIQKLYDALDSKKTTVAYFPPGRYRLTRTLTLTDGNGLWIVGHGRDSVLLWDGEAGGSMYRSNGVHRSTYEGLTYDGNGKAGICSEHCSQTKYETALTYRNCAFLNADYGIAISKNPRKLATAETRYQNLLFKNLKTGLLLNQYNDYDHWLDGCLFIDNDIGVHSHIGHFHVRNSHFLDSRAVDVRVGKPQHPGSVRWCTSEGSRQFFEMGGERSAGSPEYIEKGSYQQSFTIQDCLVKSWKSPDGAVVLNQQGPLFLFDTAFVAPPSEQPPVRLAKASGKAVLILSGNTPDPADKLVAGGASAAITLIPGGQVKPVVSAGQPRRFFADRAEVPGKVFDVKRDFNAAGDGKSDDSQAIQQAIDAARAHGRQATVYLPAGTYNLAQPLRLSGADFSVGGVGFSTILVWQGSPEAAVIQVHDPVNLTLANLMVRSIHDGPKFQRQTSADGGKQELQDYFGSKTDADRRREAQGNVKIRQTSSGQASSITYDNLHVASVYSYVPGIQLVDLPAGAVVRMGEISGSLHCRDSGQATILANIHLGRLLVDGAKLPKTGFTGMLFQNDVHRDYSLTVKDNQDLVIADFYQEQNERYALLEGGGRPGQGHVTIGASKIHSVYPEFVTVNDYEGRIWISGGCIMYPKEGRFQKNPVFVKQNGSRPLDFMLAGCYFFKYGPDEPEPIFTFAPAARFTSIGNTWGMNGRAQALGDRKPDGWAAQAALALDDFRRIGQVNLDLNYSGAKLSTETAGAPPAR